MRKFAPLLLLFSLVTAAVTFPHAQAETPDNLQHRVASPEHRWNAVVAVKEDGQVAQLFQYNPDHLQNAGREYDSEASCKEAIASDERLKADIVAVQNAVTKVATEHTETKFEVSVGCIQVDSEPQTF